MRRTRERRGARRKRGALLSHRNRESKWPGTLSVSALYLFKAAVRENYRRLQAITAAPNRPDRPNAFFSSRTVVLTVTNLRESVILQDPFRALSKPT